MCPSITPPWLPPGGCSRTSQLHGSGCPWHVSANYIFVIKSDNAAATGSRFACAPPERDQCQKIGHFPAEKITISCDSQDLYYIKLVDSNQVTSEQPHFLIPAFPAHVDRSNRFHLKHNSHMEEQ
jgi:hypothetical protein